MMHMKNCTWMLLPMLLLYGCGSSSEPVTEGEKTSGAVSIKEVNPAIVVAGKPFHPNPKGLSAIGVYGVNFTSNSRIRIGAQVLATEVNKGGTSATALVPRPAPCYPWQLRCRRHRRGLRERVEFSGLQRACAHGPRPGHRSVVSCRYDRRPGLQCPAGRRIGHRDHRLEFHPGRYDPVRHEGSRDRLR